MALRDPRWPYVALSPLNGSAANCDLVTLRGPAWTQTGVTPVQTCPMGPTGAPVSGAGLRYDTQPRRHSARARPPRSRG